MATQALTKTKTINGLAFEISQPYAEGHTLNAVEAKVLNQTRSENIGNNIRKAIAEAVEAGKSEAEIAALVAEADANYVFNERTASESRKMDPYEREARNMARELLKNHLAKTGRKINATPEGLTEDEWKGKVEGELDRISALDEVVKAARKTVDAKKKTADSLAAAMESTDV